MRKLILKNHLSFSFIKRMIVWHYNYYVMGRGTPISAGVYIIDSCNYRCKMCDIRAKKHPNIYPREKQERDIDALSKMGVIYYTISGGEPTLVKDLPERLAYAAQKIPYVHLVTNGSTMTTSLATRLGEAGIKEISISIDGADEYHNAVRGVGNAFKKAWNAIDLLTKNAPDVQIVVNSVLTLNNLNNLRQIRTRLRKEFPRALQKYLPLTYHELFLTNQQTTINLPGQLSSHEELKSFIREAITDTKVVNSRVFLGKAFQYLTGKEDVLSEQKKCLYPYHAIEFDSFGNSYPCITGSEMKNLQQDIPQDLESLVNSDNYRREQKRLEQCDRCRGSMMLCYYEPRLNFPLHNLLFNCFTK